MMIKKTYDVLNKVVRDSKGHFQKAKVFKVEAWSAGDAVRKHLGHKNFKQVKQGDKFQVAVSLESKQRNRMSFYTVK